MLNVERKQVRKEDVQKAVDTRGKPEVHIHCAVTFVWGGDPTEIREEKRHQLEHELKQFAAALKHGQIRKMDIDRVFKEFNFVVERAIRESGAMIIGG